MAQAAPALGIPSLRDYQVIEKIAAGGLGVVYRARDLKLQRTVAIKFLIDSELGPGGKQRLLREARALSTLDHPNIVAVHAVEEADDGRLFLVMGYCDGETLALRIHRGPLPPSQALDIACQVARGLGHAHAHHIIHRDIKPSNVILTRDGTAKIVDFGLARLATPTAETASLSLSGTLAYMSPEQLRGAAVDERTDIWSLGVTLYQMVAARLPFQSEGTADTILKIASRPPDPIPEAPQPLLRVFDRALAKMPAERYATCAELLEDIERLRGSGSDTLQKLSPGSFRRLRRATLHLLLRLAWAWLTPLLVALAALLAPTVRAPEQSPARGSSLSAPVAPAAYQSYQAGRELLGRFDKDKNLATAIRHFESAVTADPKFALAFAALAEAYWDKFRLDRDPQWLGQAESYCRQAIALNDRLPAVFVTLGRVHSVKDKELALEEFQRALALDPRNADAMIGIGSVYESMGRPEAQRMYEDALALHPLDWRGHQSLAAYYFNARRYDKAEQEFRRVVELAPDNARGHSNLGVTLQELNRLEEAEAEFRTSLRLDPDSRAAYATYASLGRLFYRQRRWADAAIAAEKAVKLNAKDYRVWALLGPTYEWRNQELKAQQAYREEIVLVTEALALDRDNAHLHGELGLLYARERQPRKAVTEITQALARSPDDPTVLLNAAEAYEYLGDRDRALQLSERALLQGSSKEEFETNPGLRRLVADSRFKRLAAEPVK